MAAASDYLENELLDHVLNGALYPTPTIYLGLSAADPLDDASGLSEPSGNGYARVAPGSFTIVAGAAVNAADIVFALATGSWGTLTHFAIFDALTGGNMLLHGALDASINISTDQVARLLAGQLSISVS